MTAKDWPMYGSTSLFLLLRTVSMVTTGSVDNLITPTLMQLADAGVPAAE